MQLMPTVPYVTIIYEKTVSEINIDKKKIVVPSIMNMSTSIIVSFFILIRPRYFIAFLFSNIFCVQDKLANLFKDLSFTDRCLLLIQW